MAVSPEMAARVALYRLSVEDAPPTYQSISDLRFFCGAVKRKMTLSMLLRQHNNSGRRRRRIILFASRRVPTPQAEARDARPQTPSNCKIFKPAFESVRYMSPFLSTKQSHDWITCGRSGRGSNIRVGLGGTK